MTEEEIQALKEAKEAAERKAAEAEAAAIAARAEAEKAKGDVSKVVNELTEERRKKQEALEKANIINPQQPDVNSLVEQALAAKEQERIKAELEEAISEFKGSKTEFQSDTAGIVFEKFKQELNKFNLSGIRSKAEAKARLEEVYRFVNMKEATGGELDYPGSASGGYPAPTNHSNMDKETEVAIANSRISEDKFKQLKSKYPEALSGLGISS